LVARFLVEQRQQPSERTAHGERQLPVASIFTAEPVEAIHELLDGRARAARALCSTRHHRRYARCPSAFGRYDGGT
jgi:hypothetical protein